MKKLIYYSGLDVLLQVRYSYQENALLFTSQRNLSQKEQKEIEKSLSANLAAETKQERMAAAQLFYLGKNLSLKGKLNQLDSIRPVQYSGSDIQVIHKNRPENIRANTEVPIRL